MLAGFPLGLAAAAGGLKDLSGLSFPAWAVALGGVLLLAGVLWRGPERRRLSKVLTAVVVVAGIGLFVAPGLTGTNAGLALALVTGLVPAVAGVVAMLRDDP